MFDSTTALVTYRLGGLPCNSESSRSSVLRLVDHRLEYLEYEGPISGGRGAVRRLAGGIYAAGESLQAPISLKSATLNAQVVIPAAEVGERVEFHWLDWLGLFK